MIRRRNQKTSSGQGIEINANSIRFVQVTGHVIEHLIEHPLPEGFVADDTPASGKAVAQALRALAQEHKIKYSNPHVSLSSEAAFLKLIDPPPLEGRQLEQVLPYETKKHVPFEDAETRHEILDDGAAKHVLIGAVRREHAQSRMQLLNAANINPGSLEPPALAITRAMSRSVRELTVHTHISSDHSLTMIYSPTALIIAKYNSTTGSDDFQRAPDAAERNLMHDLDELIQQEALRISHRYALIISGDFTDDGKLGSLISRQFNVTPTRADPLNGLQLADEAYTESVQRFLTPLGLALKELS